MKLSIVLLEIHSFERIDSGAHVTANFTVSLHLGIGMRLENKAYFYFIDRF